MKKVVIIGGGTGLSTFSRVLKKYAVDLTLVVTITDDGGSSGLLRKGLSMPPPGDIRNNIIALANDEELLTRIFAFRFSSESLSKHSLGNLIIAGLNEIYGSFPEAVAAASRLLQIKGNVLPVADAMVHLMGECFDGKVIEGESNVSKNGTRIKKLYLNRTVNALPEVIKSIESADIILIGPGSLYTSIIPNFLVEGVSRACKESRAKKIYIANVMTQPGETEGFSLKKHVSLVESYADLKLDEIYYSEVDYIDARIIERYKKEGATPLRNDMQEDARVKTISGTTTEIITNGKKKAVLRHSREGIRNIAGDLGLFEEADNEFRR